MELDLRLMLTIGTCLVSIVSAAAIAKIQIKNLMEDYEALRRSLSDLDKIIASKNPDLIKYIKHLLNNPLS